MIKKNSRHGNGRKKNVRTVGGEMVRRLKRFAEALDKADTLTERFTCRTVRMDLRPNKYNAVSVKQTRSLLGASQGVFAQFLGVSRRAVQDWEQGIKPPRGSACRLMDEIHCNPGYWVERLKQLSAAGST